MRTSVIDLFCGAGGLSHGFKRENFRLACGIDLDPVCRYAFETNNEADFLEMDVTNISGRWLEKKFHSDAEARILVGCAPCQPFSPYNRMEEDLRYALVSDFARLITEVRPEIVSMENVSRLSSFRKQPVFPNFVERLEKAGYYVWSDHVFCPDYGVPQTRKRLVLLASLLGEIELEPPTCRPTSYATVRDTIGGLPRLEAGEADPEDPLHRSSSLSDRNRRRMVASKPGGSWRDWPKQLITPCHRRETGKGYESIYGRMVWDAPAPTITTQFFGFGNGRFGHPEQNRALSLREGALLQDFPQDYEFIRAGDPIYFKRIGRMIGNAVPVGLSRAIAHSIRKHIDKDKNHA